MRILSRDPQNKKYGSRQFDRNRGRTKAINMQGATFRGGIRL